MHFYDINLLSLVFIGLIYFVGTSFLIKLGKKFSARFKWAWTAMVPLFLLLYAGTLAEEFWVAWNFGRLCKTDAGVFVNKTVVVDGFFDASAVLPARYGNFASESVEYYKMGGYRYIEIGLDQPAGQPRKIVHIENVHGVWRSTVIDRPVSRYYYRRPHTGTSVSHKITKVEHVVIDSKTNEVLARETRYRRRPPWFYVGDQHPNQQCPSESENPSRVFGSIYELSLIPTRNGT
jgi:hypothetical protein